MMAAYMSFLILVIFYGVAFQVKDHPRSAVSLFITGTVIATLISPIGPMVGVGILAVVAFACLVIAVISEVW